MLSTSVKSVMEMQKKRLYRDNEVKKKILKSIKDRIEKYAFHGSTRCLFDIPNFIFGYLPYDVLEIKNYILNTLSSEGFYVIIISGNVIYISWHINDVQKQQEIKKREIEEYDDLSLLMSKK
tara:strand:- start:133 stop:498 length:366 start_codon:yes stop_codon:yes gene_type:complete